MFTRNLNLDQCQGGGNLPKDTIQAGRPEQILNSLTELNSRIHDSSCSLRSLKNEFVGEAPIEPSPENPEKQQDPISFMDKLEKMIDHCRDNQSMLAKELDEFRQRALG